MSTIAIVYHSGFGHTQALAEAVARGAQSVPDTQVSLVPVAEAEAMMRREGIAWLSSTHKSIEEIATTILRDIRPDRLVY